jgi:hypothetical protein
MSMDEWPIISSYTWQQAVEDGDLVELLKHRWHELTGGIPLLATTHIFNEISLAGLMEIYNDFVMWRRDIMPTLKDEDKMFVTQMNGDDVWLIEDGSTFTLMYPEDY